MFCKQRENSKPKLWVEANVTAAHGWWHWVEVPGVEVWGFSTYESIADAVLNQRKI